MTRLYENDSEYAIKMSEAIPLSTDKSGRIIIFKRLAKSEELGRVSEDSYYILEDDFYKMYKAAKQ